MAGTASGGTAGVNCTTVHQCSQSNAFGECVAWQDVQHCE